MEPSGLVRSSAAPEGHAEAAAAAVGLAAAAAPAAAEAAVASEEEEEKDAALAAAGRAAPEAAAAAAAAQEVAAPEMASPVAAEEAAPTAAGQAAPAAADVAEVRDEAAEPGCLDLRAFPRFAPLLASTQEYAQLTGCRFQSDSLCSLSSFLLSADLSTGSGEPQSQRAELLAAKRRAAPTVLEFTERLKLGEEGLMEELEKASRMVMSESVRRGVVATAQNLCMWPPDPPPASVAEGDCAYEDTSAPMDAIAQRAWNDESQRARRGGAEGLERRVLTASYLVDFATRAGAPLPPVPETFAMMVTELQARAAEWEERQNPGGGAGGAGAARAGARHGYLLVVDSLEVSGLEDLRASNPGVGGATQASLELALGAEGRSTRALVVPLWEGGRLGFEEESFSLEFRDQPEAVVRLWLHPADGAGISAAVGALAGEAVVPLGPELRDCQPRKLLLPISRGSAHVCAVSLRLFLRYAELPPVSDEVFHPVQRVRSSISNAGAAMAEALEAMKKATSEDAPAIGARLHAKTGFGTCTRMNARAVIVTEEGSGRCFYYCYATQAEADSYFNAISWMPISRIMFNARDGVVGAEIRQGGLPFPHGTIRQAARALTEAPAAGDAG